MTVGQLSWGTLTSVIGKSASNRLVALIGSRVSLLFVVGVI